MVRRYLDWRVSAVLPTVWFLLAYLGTTAFAATVYAVVPDGYKLMEALAVSPSAQVLSDIGTPLYFAVLLLPFFLVPAAAVAVVAASRRATVFQVPNLDGLKISRSALILLMAASFGYCAFRLQQLDALNLDVLACGAAQDKMIRRLYLLDNLGFVYFMFAYGVNMMLPLLAYLGYEMQGRKRSDLAVLLASLLGMVLFVLVTYSKAPMLVFVVMMAYAVIVIRAPLRHLVVTGAVCGVAFLVVSSVVYASQACNERPQIENTDRVVPQIDGTAIRQKDKDIVRPESPSHVHSATKYIGHLLGFGVIQRMAVGFPFYVSIYKDGSERCGIQGSLLRKILGINPPRCIMGNRVFNEIWPSVTYAQGSQPAPAHVSALGELGFAWSISVMVLSGVALGAFGAFSSLGTSPLHVAFGAAAGGFGYYLTQVPFIAGFTYPHGLFAFLIPVAALFIVAVSNLAVTRKVPA